jgi:hypothetical protein
MKASFKTGNVVIVLLIGAIAIFSAVMLLQAEADKAKRDNVTAVSTKSVTTTLARNPDIPTLPFPDNPDPSLCGIPTAWGPTNNQAWLNGVYDGKMVQPTVFLYDSHLRYNIKAQALHGTEVQIILFQVNPMLNYYMVKIVGAPAGQNEGWVPEPFLSFTPLNLSARRFG